jgi:hypothetical protein
MVTLGFNFRYLRVKGMSPGSFDAYAIWQANQDAKARQTA